MKNNEERPVVILFAILFLLILICSTFVLHASDNNPPTYFIGNCMFFSVMFSIGGLVGCCVWLILTANKNN